MNGTLHYHFVEPHHGVMTLIYASAKTRDRAEAILEDCFATGEVSDHEFIAIEFIAGRYCVLVRAQ